MSKRLKGEELAKELCRQEKLTFETVSLLTEALLCKYAVGRSQALKGPNNMTPEEIIKEKQYIRRRYIEIMTGVIPYSEQTYSDFAWDVVRTRWFMDKAEMILDAIEELVDGKVSDTAYNPSLEGEHRLEGKQMKTILKMAYLGTENKIMNKKSICAEMEISETTYERRHPNAVVLFGILMWIYANRREQEDINAGIVENPGQQGINNHYGRLNHKFNDKKSQKCIIVVQNKI